MITNSIYTLLKPTKIFFAAFFVFLMVGVGSVSATEKVNSTNYSETFLPTVSTLPVANPVLSAPVFGETPPVFARTAPVSVETPPVFARTAPVFGETAPVFARIAPVFGRTAPVFARIAPVFGRTAPVFGRTAPVFYGIAPMRTRTVLVQTGLAALGTNVVPVLPKTAFILTETELFRARISQMPTRASPGITV